MTLHQLKYFKEVARTRHFTIAAQNLFISQSSLSHSVLELERELGVPLFVRSRNKKVEMTSYGRAFLPYVENVFQNLQDGQKIVNDMRNPISGVVKIVYSYVNGVSLVPQIFNEFYNENSYEEISVQFEINHARQKIEDDTVQGKYDLCICSTQSYRDLLSVPIAKQELVVILPSNHPLAQKKCLSLFDIKDEPFISYYQGSPLDKWITTMFSSCDLKPNITSVVEDWSSQYAYVSLGLGITISPRLPVDSRSISMVAIDHPLKFRDVYLLWPSNRKSSPAVEHVKNYLISASLKLHCPQP